MVVTEANVPKSIANESDKEKEDEDDFANTSCGIGSWRPLWLQVFANTKLFLINICLIGIVQSMAGSLQYTVMNTLEKRFAFDSKISAVINIADNISVMFLSPLVGYYGIRFNRSKLIGIGQLIVATSCLISALPYFIYGPAKHFVAQENFQSAANSVFKNISSSSSSSQMCDERESAAEDCGLNNRGSTVWPAVFLFFLGQFVRGIGNAIYYVIALPFVDDNVPKKSSPIYIAVMQTVMLIGPGCGLILFSFFLKLNEDPWFDPGFSRNDPRFIGAYWLCYLTVSCLILLVCTPMFLFPAQFKGASVKSVQLKKQMKTSGGFKEALKRFLSNPLILLFVLGNATRYSGIIGFYMFYVKYLETTFRISTAATGQLLGTASMLPMAVGILSGGLIIAYFKPKARAFFIFLFLAELTSVFTIGSGLFFSCPSIRLQGEGPVVDVGAGAFSLNANCNSACHCTTRVFSPLCDTSSGTTFFSPCHAGCTSSAGSSRSGNISFSECSCLTESTSSVSSGYCPDDVAMCVPPLVKFIIIMVVGNTIAQTSTTGNFLINYRSVEPMDKSFVSGIIGTIISVLSFIPVPLLYGHIADSSCLVWERKCGKQGNCWVYDNDRFRNVLFGTTVVFLSLGSFFDFLMIFFSDRLKNIYDDNEEDETGKRETINEKMPKLAEEHQMEVVKS